MRTGKIEITKSRNLEKTRITEEKKSKIFSSFKCRNFIKETTASGKDETECFKDEKAPDITRPNFLKGVKMLLLCLVALW